jgi:hypothetical protein
MVRMELIICLLGLGVCCNMGKNYIVQGYKVSEKTFWKILKAGEKGINGFERELKRAVKKGLAKL